MRQFSQYNIDALRKDDGTYRAATTKIISGALQCGHTAHLQTERGTVAFRPYTIDEVRINERTGEQYFPGEKAGKNWLVEFFPHDHYERRNEIQLYTSSLRDAIVFAYTHLNGRPHKFHTGDFVWWYSNQADREATVLAILGDEILIEYELPGTTSGRETSSLVLCRGCGDTLSYIRNYTHRKLPKRWIKAMNDQGTRDWIGLGQRESQSVPFPVAQ